MHMVAYPAKMPPLCSMPDGFSIGVRTGKSPEKILYATIVM